MPDGSVISRGAGRGRGREAAILSAQGLEDGALDAAQPVADLYVTQQQPDRPRWNAVQALFGRAATAMWSGCIRLWWTRAPARSYPDPDTGVPHPDEAAAQQSAARPDTPLFQAIDAMAQSVQRDIASFRGRGRCRSRPNMRGTSRPGCAPSWTAATSRPLITAQVRTW